MIFHSSDSVLLGLIKVRQSEHGNSRHIGRFGLEVLQFSAFAFMSLRKKQEGAPTMGSAYVKSLTQ